MIAIQDDWRRIRKMHKHFKKKQASKNSRYRRYNVNQKENKYGNKKKILWIR